jgi:hypothetical protein
MLAILEISSHRPDMMPRAINSLRGPNPVRSPYIAMVRRLSYKALARPIKGRWPAAVLIQTSLEDPYGVE